MNDLKVSDIMCKWYIWAVVGYVIGKNLSDTLGGLIGLAIGGLIGCYIQKNHSKKMIDNFQLAS
ncbi:MAG: hypothetical protein ACLROW_20165 [Roseburia faecis]